MATVLIVDDDVMVREVVRTALERVGYQVVEAADGAEALRESQRTPVDVMILDVMMPNKGGIETLMEMRKSAPELKTIVITGKVDTDSASFKNLIQAFAVRRVFPKPFALAELTGAVADLLAE